MFLRTLPILTSPCSNWEMKLNILSLSDRFVSPTVVSRPTENGVILRDGDIHMGKEKFCPIISGKQLSRWLISNSARIPESGTGYWKKKFICAEVTAKKAESIRAVETQEDP